MDEFLNTLKTKEREILIKLENTPAFKLLESLRQTIASYEASMGKPNDSNGAAVTTGGLITRYDPDNFTWKQKVEFVLTSLGEAGVGEIISKIKEWEEGSYAKVWLVKRVGVTVSQMKKAGVIGVKVVNKKNKYFLN